MFFNKTRLKLWAQKGSYIRPSLATVLIARRNYQETKEELGKRGIYGKQKKATKYEGTKCF